MCIDVLGRLCVNLGCEGGARARDKKSFRLPYFIFPFRSSGSRVGEKLEIQGLELRDRPSLGGEGVDGKCHFGPQLVFGHLDLGMCLGRPAGVFPHLRVRAFWAAVESPSSLCLFTSWSEPLVPGFSVLFSSPC